MALDDSNLETAAEESLPSDLAAATTSAPTIGTPPVEAPVAPKGPTAEQEREKALASVRQKWDKAIADSNRESGVELEIPSDDEPATGVQADDAGGEGTAADDVAAPDAVDLAHRQRLAAQHGVSVEWLAGFTSAKDAEQALRLYDADLFTGKLRQPQQKQPAVGQPTEQLTPQQQARKDLGLDYSEWEENEPVRKNLSKLEQEVLAQSEVLQQLIEQNQTFIAEQHSREASSRLQTFHSTLDGLNPELFGTASEQTPQQTAMREYLMQKVAAAADELEASGYEAPRDTAAFTARVAQFLKLPLQPAKNQSKATGQPPAPTKPRPQLAPPGRAQPRVSSPNGKMEDFKGDPRDNPRIKQLYEDLEEKSAAGY